MKHRIAVRNIVRRELSLHEPLLPAPHPARKRSAALLRVTAAAALLCGVSASAAWAQAPYRQEVIPGFSSLDAGEFSSPNLVDLDADGDLDAIVGEENGTLRCFVNIGTNANPALVEATSATNPFTGIDVGEFSSPNLVDLDADGDLDAIVGERYGTLRYFVNTGTTASPAFVEATGAANPFSGIDVGSFGMPELADLDADNDLDAIVGAGSGILRYFLNTGTTTSPAFVEATGAANPLSGIDVGSDSTPDMVDLDADGDLDAIVGEHYGTLRYFTNTGTSASPAFAEGTGAANPFTGIDVGRYSSPDLADLDGDGDLDAIVGGWYGDLSYYVNTGTTTSPAFVPAAGAANPLCGIDFGYDSDPNLVDLDGDGDLDAIVGEVSPPLRYMVNTGTSARPAYVEATGAANPFSGITVASDRSPELADLDADGDLDAILGDVVGILRYLVNTGTSTNPAFVAATGAANPFTGIDVGSNASPDLADLDADDDLDAIVGGHSGTIRYFVNAGTTASPGYFEATGAANPFSGIAVNSFISPELADLDADGDLDAIVGNNIGTLCYFANTGTSASPAFVEVTGAANPFAGIDVGDVSTPALVDLDADGDLDLLVGENGGRLVFYRSLAAEVFADGFEDGSTSAWSLTVPTP